MSPSEPVPDPLAERLSLIRPHLDQRAWRLLLGAEAKVLGRGGIKTVAGPGIGVAVDDEIDAETGRGIDRPGSQGVGDNGREAAERVRVQLAGERESR